MTKEIEPRRAHDFVVKTFVQCLECGALCEGADVKERERYWPKHEKQTSCQACFLKRNREHYAGSTL